MTPFKISSAVQKELRNLDRCTRAGVRETQRRYGLKLTRAEAVALCDRIVCDYLAAGDGGASQLDGALQCGDAVLTYVTDRDG